MTLWKIKPKISEGNKLSTLELDEVTTQLLSNRGIEEPENATKFLSPKESDIYDGANLGDIDKAVSRIEKAIAKKQKIIVYGDFDVDGIIGTTILWEYLYKRRGSDVLPYIPSKVDEGYGLNKEALVQFAKRKVDLVITVDCGIRDYDLIKEFNHKPFDIIITDHHEPGKKIPKASAVVHPGLPGSKYMFRNISGATVVWKLIAEMEKRKGLGLSWFESFGGDLVIISTICDLMPLVDENRAMVTTLLPKLQGSQRIGLRSLVTVSGVPQSELDTYHIGYMLGPRLNAAGRLKEAIIGVQLLSTEKQKLASALANELDILNKQRQKLTQEALEEAEEILKIEEILPKVLILMNERWHEGIIGLVAGKMTEKYHRPTIAFTRSKRNQLIGSARSIEEFNMINAIESVSNLLIRYGGHAQAAGLTIEEGSLGSFREKMTEFASAGLGHESISKKLNIDMELKSQQLSFDVIEKISRLKPFGFGNPKPIFSSSKLKYISGKRVGEKGDHLKFQVSDESGKVLNCISFNKGNFYEELVLGDYLDLAFYLEENSFSGNTSLELKVLDIKNSSE